MTRRQREIERLGGIPYTSPDRPEETGVLRPENHAEIHEPTEVTATFGYDRDGRLDEQELTVHTPGVELTDGVRRAASRSDKILTFEF